MDGDRPHAVSRPASLAIFAYTLVLGLAFYFTLARVHLGLADEGFLWYGFQRTLVGEVPLRDFQSYEPCRYYICALFGWLMNSDGILAVRAGIVAFFSVGVFFVLRLLWRHKLSVLSIAIAGPLFFVWAYPIHKLFEHAMTMLAVCVAVRLLERPSVRQHLLAGIFVGFAGFMGRNHGLYSGLGIGLASLVVLVKHRDREYVRKPGALALGTLIGFSPMFAMMLFIPGFAQALWDSILFYAQAGVNISIPVPWPWTAEWVPRRWVDGVSVFAVGSFFCLFVVVYGAGLVALWRTSAEELPRRALFIGAILVGIVYSHHASVRSDPWHLAQSVPPVLIAMMGLGAAFPLRSLSLRLSRNALVWGLIPLLSVAAAMTSSPAFGTLHRFPSRLSPGGKARLYDLGAGDKLLLPPKLIQYLVGLRALGREYMAPDETFFAAPNKPSAYAILRRKSPVWHTFFLWPENRRYQKRLARELESTDVRWILLTWVEGDERMHFKNTHPFVWRYITRNFARIDSERVPRGHAFLKKREERD